MSADQIPLRLLKLQRKLHNKLDAVTTAAGPDYTKAVVAGGIDTEAAGIASSVGVLSGIIGGIMRIAESATAELDAVKADLEAQPTIDSSASDAEAAATAADMPDAE